MRSGSSSRRVYALVAGIVIALVYFFSFHGDSDYISRDFQKYYSGIHVGGWGGGGSDHHTAGDEEVLDELGRFKEVEKIKTLDDDEVAAIPETVILSHVVGYTIFERLYAFNGTIFIVTSNVSAVPDVKYITSQGIPILNGADEDRKRLPTDNIIRVVTPNEALQTFGGSIDGGGKPLPLYPPPTVFPGFSFVLNEDKQFVNHYFHFTAELLFGLWRSYSSLDPNIPPSGATSLPEPQRLQFVHTDYAGWRDGPLINPYVLRAVYPTMALEFKQDWDERAKSGAVHVWERVLYADRGATRLGKNYQATRRPASEAMVLPGSAYWWETVRSRVLRASGLTKEWIFGKAGDDTRYIAGTHVGSDPSRLVVTYISRQGGPRRKLRQADHDNLVKELEKLRDHYGYEVNIVDMKDLTLAEQFQLAGRTTIMMGVHGNGLTSLVWMRPTPRATVIEFFVPDGFAPDYWYTTNHLGMTHYGVWKDKVWTGADTPRVNYPDGFQGNEIPLDGAAVAKLVHRRLQLRDAEENTTDDA